MTTAAKTHFLEREAAGGEAFSVCFLISGPDRMERFALLTRGRRILELLGWDFKKGGGWDRKTGIVDSRLESNSSAFVLSCCCTDGACSCSCFVHKNAINSKPLTASQLN